MRSLPRVAATITTLFLIAAGFLSAVPLATAATVSVNLVSLPAGSHPVSLVYYSGHAYYPSYDFGTVFKVDLTSNTYSTLVASSGNFHRDYKGTTVDVSGNLWVTRCCAPNPPDLQGAGVSIITQSGKETMLINQTLSVNTASQTLYSGKLRLPNGTDWSCVACTEFGGITYRSGFVYTVVGGGSHYLLKISTTSPYAVHAYVVPGVTGGNEGFAFDGSANLWFTDRNSNSVCKFDGSAVQCYAGSTHPRGIAVSGVTGYVAENDVNGNIDSFQLSSPSSVAKTPVSGTPVDVHVFAGIVYWSSSGSDHNICVLNGICVATGEVNYFLADNGASKLLFSYLGSAGIGSIEGLGSASPSDTATITSTTTTTGGTTTTTTTTSSLTSSSASSTPSTTTTSTATTDTSGCVIGSKCPDHWTPIVIPIIHVSSILRNVNRNLAPDGNVTIAGFEFFLAGPSSGDFVQMVSLVGCCAFMMSNLNPSNGTFATMSVSARPYNLNNYPSTMTPRPIVNSTLTPTSMTRFGWLCTPDFNPKSQLIVDFVWSCYGNALPINYRTFSFTVPTHTIVTIQATGTDSDGQISVENIFT